MCDFVKSSIQSFYNYKFSRILFVIVHTRKSMKASMYKYGQKAEDLIALRYFAAFQWSVNPVSAETLSPVRAFLSVTLIIMQKAKKYDWKDSNMALFGTDVERNVLVLYATASRHY